MPRPDDDALFRRYLDHGDAAALAGFVAATWPTLLARARQLARSEHLAWDLTQETYAIAIEKRGSFDVERRAVPWLIGILSHLAMRAIRSAVAGEPAAAVSSASDGPEARAQAAELRAMVDRAIDALPPRYRTVLRLHLEHDLTPAEIAQRLGLQPATARVRLHRGLLRLRRRLPATFVALLLVRTTVAASAPRAWWREPCAIALGLPIVPALWLLGATVAGGERVIEPTRVAVVETPSSERSAVPESPGERRLALASATTGDLIVTVATAGGPLAKVGVQVVPATGVVAWLHGRRGVSGNDGCVRFEGLPAGRYEIRTDRDVTLPVDVTPGSVCQARIDVAAGCIVRGRVVDESGAPIAGASIWLGDATAAPDAGTDVCRSDAAGRFELECVRGGQRLAARAAGRARARPAVVPTDADEVEVLFRMAAAAGTLAGRVLDPCGDPVEGALVLVGADPVPSHEPVAAGDATPAYELRTDALGSFRTSGLEPGEHAIVILAEGCAPLHDARVVASGAAVQAHYRLQRGASLAGVIRDGVGAPVAGAVVTARGWEPQPFATVVTGSDGAYELPALASGRQVVSVRAAGFASHVVDLDLAPGTRSRREASLERLPEVCGRVVGTDGVPFAGWEVAGLFGNPVRDPLCQATGRTDASGRFALAAAAATTTDRLLVRAPDTPTWISLPRLPRPTADLTVVLPAAMRAPAECTGRLVSADGEPIERARLFVATGPMGWGSGWRTTAGGAFRLGPLPGGTYRARALRSAPGSAMLDCGSVTVEPGRGLFTELRLPRLGRLSCQVQRTDGAELEGARLTVFDLDGASVGVGAIDAAWDLAPGRYRVRATAHNATWIWDRDVEVRGGETTQESFAMRPAAQCPVVLTLPFGHDRDHLRGRCTVYDAEGRALDRLTVRFDPWGRAAVRLVLPGDRVTIEVETDDRTWLADVTIDARTPATRPVEIVLRSGSAPRLAARSHTTTSPRM